MSAKIIGNADGQNVKAPFFLNSSFSDHFFVCNCCNSECG
jgi:hypothetical protein